MTGQTLVLDGGGSGLDVRQETTGYHADFALAA